MKAILLLVGLSLSGLVSAGELEERAKVHHTVALMFAAGDFAALEELATKYRTEQTRTPSGTWKLTEFYDGLTKKGLGFAKDEQAAWDRVFKTIDEWIVAYPSSPTPYVVKGAALMNRGWAYRGEGWASGVKKEDSSQYRQFASKAAQYLIENRRIGALDPHWYYLVADTHRALGASKEQYMALMHEALDQYPDYDPLYFKSSGYLSPKWYGSLEELEEFAQSSVERTKATRGYEVYARIYWASGRINKRKFAFEGPHANWDDMVKGMREVTKRYPSQWNVNHFAFFSCIKNDFNKAAEFVDMIVEPFNQTAWGSDRNYYQCRALIDQLELKE